MFSLSITLTLKSMKIEDLDSFVDFEIWDFDDFPASLMAWNKKTFREERLYLDRFGKLASSFQ